MVAESIHPHGIGIDLDVVEVKRHILLDVPCNAIHNVAQMAFPS
jgi:hypothetical protein